ncbi:MAG: bifunctional phosphoglucose/phosphomannose isomerase [Candidatus Bathyarchaeota archaeon]
MKTILDDPINIEKVDKSRMLDDLTKTADYCRDAIKLAKKVNLDLKFSPKNIVIIGMGGSAIGGEILHDWLRDNLPLSIEVCRDYILPAYVNEDTLVFANSYSDFCKKLKVPHIIIPSGLQPRAAIPYLFFPFPIIMQKLGILSNIEAELEEAIIVFEKISKENTVEVPSENNKAKKLALDLKETIPTIYGFREYTSIAHRLKAQFNENSKLPSKSDIFPELNHNETVGYEAPESLIKKHSIILIRDPNEPKELRNRIETTKNLVFIKANKTLEIFAEGKGKLAKMFSIMCIGDYASVYLAILQNKDPSPVKIIDKVKNELSKKSDMKQKFEEELSKLV